MSGIVPIWKQVIKKTLPSVDRGLDPDSLRLLTPVPVLGMYIPPSVSVLEAEKVRYC